MTSQKSQPPIVYVTRDIERALAMAEIEGNTAIITNAGQEHNLPGDYPIIEVSSDKLLDTRELLQADETIAYLNQQKEAHGGVNILVFKSSVQIERICTEHDWNLLNNSAELTNEIENKVSGVHWLGSLSKLLPPHNVAVLKTVSWNNEPFILQFNRAHTGLGTMLISSAAELKKQQALFPDRDVRITKFIDGPMFTSNNVVHANGVLVGNVSYQITGLEPFTNNPFATIGNDWGLANEVFDDNLREQHRAIVALVGEKLRFAGYKGLFGIDVILDEKENKLMLIEINARQPASTTFESSLQEGLTTFAAHVQALLGEEIAEQIADVTQGSQIIVRTSDTRTTISAQTVQKLTKEGFTLRTYKNEKPGADLLRIMWRTGSFMQAPNQLSDAGQTIANLLS